MSGPFKMKGSAFYGKSPLESNDKGISGVSSSKAPSSVRPFGPGTRPLSKGVVKGLTSFGKRFLGPVGLALTAYDVAKAIPDVIDATIKSKRKEAKTGIWTGRKL